MFDHLIGLRLTRSDHPSIPKIQTLPATIGNLQFLSSLELANNQLRDLPVAIGKLKNLTWLDLYNNQIQEFPNMIGDLTSLENIDLSMNQLQTIREELGEEFNCFSSRNFKTLNLSGNPIAEFPDTIGNLRHKREGVYVAKHRFHEPLGI
ncbi:MAG TPA: leucine-rich repeat domain-containing protein [Chlamydiales bacterium]|nr:leucine-rich repeat domain-containing protein [Chlamydiales bacterium]